MILAKAVRKLSGDSAGQLFVQCTKAEEWDALLENWRKAVASHRADGIDDNSQLPPCPMPRGHKMFSRPLDYNCKAVTVAQVGFTLVIGE